MTGAEWAAIAVALVALAGNVVLFIMGALKERALKQVDANQGKDLERLKSELTASAAKKLRLETLQQEAIFQLYAVFREAVHTAELFVKDKYGRGFKNIAGHTADYLIGNDWGNAYRKLDEKGLLFEQALATAMRDLLDTIEKIQRAVSAGNQPLTYEELNRADNARTVAWEEAAKLVRDELNPQWAKLTAEFQRMLGIDVPLDAGQLTQPRGDA